MPARAAAEILRTPDACFADLPGFPHVPRYLEVEGLRIACIDEGPRDAPVVLLMHGEPTWSYLYRKMIPVLVDAGLRAVAPDLVGFGRSDKPADPRAHSYASQVRWMSAWLRAADLRGVTLFCQDWGSLIGLRMAAEAPERFDRIVLANGGLPTGMQPMPRAFVLWRAFARWSPWFPIGRIVAAGCARGLGARERAAYDAPFPDARYRIAARLLPGFVPAGPDDPERAANARAWTVFRAWDKPFLTLFSTRDPITRGGERAWQAQVPGARDRPHRRIRGAGHFLQEDAGEEIARELAAFLRSSEGAGGPRQT
jgi:haloalkane dehalogenase